MNWDGDASSQTRHPLVAVVLSAAALVALFLIVPLLDLPLDATTEVELTVLALDASTGRPIHATIRIDDHLAPDPRDRYRVVVLPGRSGNIYIDAPGYYPWQATYTLTTLSPSGDQLRLKAYLFRKGEPLPSPLTR